MANIFLTKKCNLKCPYCFADEFVNKENDEISIENFKNAINFIKQDENERIGLIGGEPTLHSKFSEILDILINDENIKKVVIFTNGLEIDKYLEQLKNEKFSILINCNSSDDIGAQRYTKLKENIKLLSPIMDKRLNLGINIYSPNMDYSYIFELLKIADKHFIRFSTALPNDFKEETSNILESFKEIKPKLFNFFKDCYNNKIVPSNDCNSFPDCIFTTEEKKLLIKLSILGKEYNLQSPIETCKTCSPVIDILPDLTAVRCFGLSKSTKIQIKDFKTIENIRKYFINKVDLYAKLSFIDKNCENCKMRYLDKCGICFTYKLKKSAELKEFILNKAN